MEILIDFWHFLKDIWSMIVLIIIVFAVLILLPAYLMQEDEVETFKAWQRMYPQHESIPFQDWKTLKKAKLLPNE